MKEEAGTVKTPQTFEMHDDWTQVQELACELTVDIPLPSFTIADARAIGPKTVLNSWWRVSRDVPLRANGELIAYGEFEVVGECLAVRLTELA